MLDKTGSYKFKVPADSTHQDAGKQFEKSFDYTQAESADEAQSIADEKGWTLLDFVNDKLF